MSTRDKYDRGKAAERNAERLRSIVRQSTQRECERRTLDRAFESPERHVPGTLEHALVVAYMAEVGR